MLTEFSASGYTPLTPRRSGPGLEGEAESESGTGTGQPGQQARAMYLIGNDARESQWDRDNIRFVSPSAGQQFMAGPANYGFVEVEYRLEKGQAGFGSEEETSVLVREERPAAPPSTEVSETRRVVVPIASKIEGLNFRYLRDGRWVEEWKETRPALPEAIEITLAFEGAGNNTEIFRTAVALSPLSRRRRNQAR